MIVAYKLVDLKTQYVVAVGPSDWMLEKCARLLNASFECSDYKVLQVYEPSKPETWTRLEVEP